MLPPKDDHLILDFSGPPPDFSLYDAEFFQVGYEDIVSHDPHLNTDGEALYRFLIAQSARIPFCRLHCRGTHTEHKSRWVTDRDSNGRTQSRRETYSETVTDFDFCIDIKPGQELDPQPTHWSVADHEPAYRGLMVREVEMPLAAGKRTATRKEIKEYKAFVAQRKALGLPPWVADLNTVWTEGVSEQDHVLKSSMSLRQWADEYCASPKHLKEFVYDQVLYGWDMQELEDAICANIKSTPYNGSLEVDFTMHRSKIYIRPDNKLSRMLSNKWLKFLSIILLVFPFIWLFKRFHSRGGGRWEVCGGAYPLKRWVPLDDVEEDSDAAPPTYDAKSAPSAGPSTMRASSSKLIQTSTGPKKLLGLREGDWFRSWEHVISRAVVGRYQSTEPLLENRVQFPMLDGYNDPL